MFGGRNPSPLPANEPLSQSKESHPEHGYSHGQAWACVPILNMISSVIAAVLTLTLLAVFLFDRNLHTPFSIHIVNLLISSFVYVFFEGFGIVTSWHPEWLLGKGVCTCLLYGLYGAAGIVMHAPLLVTVNRLWALLQPRGYNKYHNKKTALLKCIAAWVYIHIVVFYGILNDELYYRIPPIHGVCFLNVSAQFRWNTVVHWLMFSIPLLFVVLANTYLVFHLCKRTHPTRLDSAAASTSKGQPSGGNHNEARHSEVRHVEFSPGAVHHTGAHLTAPDAPAKAMPKSSHQGTTMLVWLTVSLVVCWSPALLFFTVKLLNVDAPIVWFYLAGLMFAMRAVVDPVVIALTFPDVRKSVKRLMRRKLSPEGKFK